MSQLRAVVLEKNNKKITVLTTNGSFQTLRYKGNVEIGEEIQLPTQSKVSIWRIGTSIAAVFLLTFMGIFGWSAFQPRTAVAMISLDINPSLQFTLDQKGEVLELESLNSDADQLITGLSLKGKTWEKALNEIIQKSVALKYLTEEQRWVVVGYSSVEPDKELSNETINTEKITKKVLEAVHEQGLTPTVAVYELTSEQKKQAHDTGLSLGEYALVDTAQKAGVEVRPETVKEKDQRERLLDTPEIQEQLRKDKRVMEGINPFLEQNIKSNQTTKDSKDKTNKKEDNQDNNNSNSKDNKDKSKENESKNNDNKGLGNQGNSQDRGNDKGSIENNRATDKSDNKKGDTDNNRGSNNENSSKENNNKVNEKAKYEDQEKDSRLKQNNDQNRSKYNWDFRTILRLSYSQRG